MMVRLGLATALLASAGAAQAVTVISYVEPVTFERYTRVYDTPGPDRALMCIAPPAMGGCTEVPIRKAPRR